MSLRLRGGVQAIASVPMHRVNSPSKGVDVFGAGSIVRAPILQVGQDSFQSLMIASNRLLMWAVCASMVALRDGTLDIHGKHPAVGRMESLKSFTVLSSSFGTFPAQACNRSSVSPRKKRYCKIRRPARLRQEQFLWNRNDMQRCFRRQS